MENKTISSDSGAVVPVRGGGLSADDGHRTYAVGEACRTPCYRSARIAMRSRILIAFSLMLGSAPIGFAQINHDHTNERQFASGGWGPTCDSARRCIKVGDFTYHHLALCLVSAPKSDPNPGLNYLIPPSPEGGIAESNEPSLTNSPNLADLAPTAALHSWRFGDAGVLNYTAPNQRWRFVVGYATDIGALRDTFGDIHSFNVAWQYSLGKRKPASWAGVKTGSEYLRHPAPR
jgi:hypothetical protein